jgi:hypothetical protein
VLYANCLSRIAVKATKKLKPSTLPTESLVFRREVLGEYKQISFESVLRFAWNHGVNVIPLRDRGEFYGATWRESHRNVVILKQHSLSLDRWLSDLIQGLFHAARHPQQADLEVIESDKYSFVGLRAMASREAIQFAGDVLLNDRAAELADECIKSADGRVERLKSVVPQVARKAGVSTGALADYLAYCLSLRGVNWCRTAANLQVIEGNPWLVARDLALAKLDFSRLDTTEQQLLNQALSKKMPGT